MDQQDTTHISNKTITLFNPELANSAHWALKSLKTVHRQFFITEIPLNLRKIKEILTEEKANTIIPSTLTLVSVICLKT